MKKTNNKENDKMNEENLFNLFKKWLNESLVSEKMQGQTSSGEATTNQVVQYAQPSVQYAQPPVQYTQPPVQYAQPPVQYVQPPVQYVQPPVQYTQPVQYAQPPVQYAQPPVQYAQPPEQINEIEKQIQQLNNLIQANALSNAAMPKEETVQDILAQIINPKEVTK